MLKYNYIILFYCIGRKLKPWHIPSTAEFKSGHFSPSVASLSLALVETGIQMIGARCGITTFKTNVCENIHFMCIQYSNKLDNQSKKMFAKHILQSYMYVIKQMFSSFNIVFIPLIFHDVTRVYIIRWRAGYPTLFHFWRGRYDFYRLRPAEPFRREQ